ncbi:MAG: M55 family metallopeptidase, partial [Candidatus Omnitrophica bacterium]|nr:M55 family metallopeptidase [Candidatus Omnitrophota bacterium]
MRIYIMTDLEGVAGVVDFESQAYDTGKYYEKAKELLTEEINAAVDGAMRAGATEVLVCDSHGPGGIIPEMLHPSAKLLHGRPIGKFWEIDSSKWDGLFLLAHHSMNGTPDGNLNHTYSSKAIVKMLLNGSPIGEIGMNIYLAGWFGIPAVLVTGDEAACREARQYVPAIEAVSVKKGINRTTAISISPVK